MPYFCQRLQAWNSRTTDLKFARHLRWVTYRLEYDDGGVLRWRTWDTSEWYAARGRTSAYRRATIHKDKTVPVLDVRHGGKLTAAQAKRLTGIKDRAAWDRVHDDDHPRYRGAVETLPAESEPADAP